jgi:poly(A) polymerase
MGAQAAEAQEYLADDRRRAMLKTAALLHDLGKPPTCRPKSPGWSAFHGHETAGARLAMEASLELGLPKAVSATVSRLVGEHMRPFHLMGPLRRGQLTSRAVRRMLSTLGEQLPGVFLLAMADTMAGKGDRRPDDAEVVLLDLYAQVAEMRDRWLAQALAAPPLITGRDLMTELGMKSGPEVGRLLKLVREAQLDGEVKDRTGALQMARQAHEVNTRRKAGPLV